eukprot:scaffold70985_cov84-Phaeocystis_antarctica.AAC.1
MNSLPAAPAAQSFGSCSVRSQQRHSVALTPRSARPRQWVRRARSLLWRVASMATRRRAPRLARARAPG